MKKYILTLLFFISNKTEYKNKIGLIALIITSSMIEEAIGKYLPKHIKNTLLNNSTEEIKDFEIIRKNYE